MILGKILYVDDDKLLTSTFTTLMKVEGFKDVVVFNNPIEAVEYLLAGYLAIDMMKGSVGEQVGLKLQQMGYNCLSRAHDNDVQVGVEVMPQQEVHSTLVNSRRGHYYGL